MVLAKFKFARNSNSSDTIQNTVLLTSKLVQSCIMLGPWPPVIRSLVSLQVCKSGANMQWLPAPGDESSGAKVPSRFPSLPSNTLQNWGVGSVQFEMCSVDESNVHIQATLL